MSLNPNTINQSYRSVSELLSLLTDDAQCGKKAFIQFANNVGPDQHAYLCNVICAFSVCRHILQYPLIMLADNVGPDQPVLMHRLIRAYIICKLHKGPFCVLHINFFFFFFLVF